MEWSGMERLFFPPSQKCDGGTSKGADGIGWERTGVDWRGSSFRRRRNVTAELPKDGRGSEWIGVDRNGVERLFFPQSQKCDGGTSKGREWTGREWIGKDGRGREGI